jgi:hypothetical protein
LRSEKASLEIEIADNEYLRGNLDLTIRNATPKEFGGYKENFEVLQKDRRRLEEKLDKLKSREAELKDKTQSMHLM